MGDEKESRESLPLRTNVSQSTVLTDRIESNGRDSRIPAPISAECKKNSINKCVPEHIIT